MSDPHSPAPEDPYSPEPTFSSGPDDPYSPEPTFSSGPEDPYSPEPTFSSGPDDPYSPEPAFSPGQDDPYSAEPAFSPGIDYHSDSPRPVTPPREKIMLGPDLELESEFRWDKHCFKHNDSRIIFPILSDVTNTTGIVGLSSEYATINTCQTSMIIREATQSPNDTKYFGNCFSEKLSLQQLVDSKSSYEKLFDFMIENGVTSKREYELRIEEFKKGETGKDEVNLVGCKRFSLANKKVFIGSSLKVTPDQIAHLEKLDFDDDVEEYCPFHIRMRGPVTGALLVGDDADTICDVPLYIPPERNFNGKSTLISYVVMLIGYGIAKHLKTSERTCYYVFQDNAGTEGKESNIGRTPCENILSAYGVFFDQQGNLDSFMKLGGNETVSIVLKDMLGSDYSSD